MTNRIALQTHTLIDIHTNTRNKKNNEFKTEANRIYTHAHTLTLNVAVSELLLLLLLCMDDEMTFFTVSHSFLFFSIHTDTTQSPIKYTGHTELNRRRRRFCFVYVLVRQCICICIFCGRNFVICMCPMIFVQCFSFSIFFFFLSSLSFFIESDFFFSHFVSLFFLILTHFSRFTLFSLVFLRFKLNCFEFWVWFGFSAMYP